MVMVGSFCFLVDCAQHNEVSTPRRKELHHILEGIFCQFAETILFFKQNASAMLARVIPEGARLFKNGLDFREKLDVLFSLRLKLNTVKCGFPAVALSLLIVIYVKAIRK